MKLFTDIDLDGLGCGIIAKLAFGEEANVSYCSYRNLNQLVEKFIQNRDSKNTETYITDLSVNEAIEKKLEKRFQDGHLIQMIDHHVTALHFNRYKWGLVKPEYEDGKKTCATSLFYDYLKEHQKIHGSKGLEEFIELVRQYDTWEWEVNNNVMAKRLNDLFYILNRESLEVEILKRLREDPNTFTLNEPENFLLDIEERKIDRYILSKNRQMVQTFADEYCVGIVHAEQYLSELGNALNKLNPHLDMIVLLNTGGKKVGFRTIHDHVDVSEFATRFGGGGHPKASGSELTKQAFEKFIVNVFPLLPAKFDADKNERNVKDASYGSIYENRDGDYSYIRLQSKENYEVIHKGKKLEETFPSYESAENYVKRNFVSWLSYDNDLIRHLCSTLQISAEEVKENYRTLLLKVMANTQKKD
jgi:uncharacterized protein